MNGFVAWFQAEANVRVSASNSQTTVSVSAPPDVEVGTKLYYCTANNHDQTHKGYNGTPTLTFDADDTDSSGSTDSFAPVTNSSQTTLDGLYPGCKMTFMIRVHADVDLNGIGLQMKDLTAECAGRASSAESPSTDVRNEYGGGFITLANAIRIWTYVIDNESHFVTASITNGVNAFTYSPDTQTYSLRAKAGSFGETAYIFYTIYFDDTPSSDAKTTYLEYTNGDYNVLYIGDTPSNTTRFFKQSEDGDSNAYEGLTFTIAKLAVTVG